MDKIALSSVVIKSFIAATVLAGVGFVVYKKTKSPEEAQPTGGPVIDKSTEKAKNVDVDKTSKKPYTSEDFVGRFMVNKGKGDGKKIIEENLTREILFNLVKRNTLEEDFKNLQSKKFSTDPPSAQTLDYKSTVINDPDIKSRWEDLEKPQKLKEISKWISSQIKEKSPEQQKSILFQILNSIKKDEIVQPAAPPAVDTTKQ